MKIADSQRAALQVGALSLAVTWTAMPSFSQLHGVQSPTSRPESNRKPLKSAVTILLLVGSILFTPGVARESLSQTMTLIPGQGTLADKLDWALGQRGTGVAEPIWFGYSVKQSQSNSFVYRSKYWDYNRSIAKLIGLPNLEPTDDDVTEAARRAIDNIEGKDRVVKSRGEVALLLQVTPAGAVVDARIMNMEQEVPASLTSLFWSGQVRTDAAADFAFTQFNSAKDVSVREGLVDAIGIMDEAVDSFGMLKRVYAIGGSSDIRQKAIFWIGRQNTDVAYEFVKGSLRSDPSADVREHAVFVLSRFDRSDAVDTLVDVASNSDDEPIRETARFWISQMISKELLGERHESREDGFQVQRQALFALTQDADTESVDMLVDLAKNSDSISLRREAIHILGRLDNERALPALLALRNN